MLTGPIIIAVIAFGGLWLRRRLSSRGTGGRRHAGPLLPGRRLAEQAAPGGPTAYRPRPGEPYTTSRPTILSGAELGSGWRPQPTSARFWSLGDPLRMVPA